MFPDLGTLITSSTAITTTLVGYLNTTLLIYIVGFAVAGGLFVFFKRQILAFLGKILGGLRRKRSRRARY